MVGKKKVREERVTFEFKPITFHEFPYLCGLRPLDNHTALVEYNCYFSVYIFILTCIWLFGKGQR